MPDTGEAEDFHPPDPTRYDPPQGQALPDSKTEQSNGLGVAALILGIVTTIGALLPFLNYFTGIIAVVGIGLAAIAFFGKKNRSATTIAGLTLSIVGLILSVLLAFIYTAGFINVVDIGEKSAPDGEAALPTTKPEAAPEPDAEPSRVGTRDNPAPLGQTLVMKSGGSSTYEITAGPSILNNNEAIAAENQFNDPAPNGFQFATLTLNITYLGDETGLPWTDIDISFVSAAGTTHEERDLSVVGPSALYGINELYKGATGMGTVTILIPTENAEAGTWVIDSIFGSDPFFLKAQ